ncbi:MAG TPA: hypothetical protein VGF02_11085 [Pseudolabrys sp.]|jgi:hypothetical protein
MRKQLALFAVFAFTLSALMLSVICAQAMPAAPLKGVSKSDQVIQVRGGCGPLRHRGPGGHCRPGP